ncbi:MAG: NADH-quinone oxidoreductase subunit C [Firmicutes bacterium]|nr:NADH-quinone oxidoreductase subunit C [Bacillota bacterium]
MTDTFRNQVAELLNNDYTFGGLYATKLSGSVKAVFISPNGALKILECQVQSGEAPSIADLVPSNWDEREAHDLYQISFNGHSPLRPLVEHDPISDHWTVAVKGSDVYQIAVGPIHAGIIESGHFRFHVIGDRILFLDTQLFYKYRGLEIAAENKTLHEGKRYVERMCMGCSVANALAYVQACEEIIGYIPSAKLRILRTVLLELERLWNHLNDIAAICAGVGMSLGNQIFLVLSERIRRLNFSLTGHRYLSGTIDIGEIKPVLTADNIENIRSELESVRLRAKEAWRELIFNSSFAARLEGVGVVDTAQIRRLGAVGPAARAAGLKEDFRAHSTKLDYENFEAVIPENPKGDVRSRLEQRYLEFLQSTEIIFRLIRKTDILTDEETACEPKPLGIGITESARGRTLCIVEASEGRIERLHMRTGSYANWSAVAYAAVGNLLPDFPLINKSFELCYACSDR